MAKHVVDIHECHEPALSGSEAHSRSRVEEHSGAETRRKRL